MILDKLLKCRGHRLKLLTRSSKSCVIALAQTITSYILDLNRVIVKSACPDHVDKNQSRCYVSLVLLQIDLLLLGL